MHTYLNPYLSVANGSFDRHFLMIPMDIQIKHIEQSAHWPGHTPIDDYRAFHNVDFLIVQIDFDIAICVCRGRVYYTPKHVRGTT